jgi:hypothetical protein
MPNHHQNQSCYFKLNEFWSVGLLWVTTSLIDTLFQRCRFVHVSSAGVTRPGRPGLDLDKQPPAVRMNDELGGLLTFKLKVSL